MNEIEKTVLAVMVTDELLERKQKILAIKIVRLMYSATLQEAKDFVDRLETKHEK